jgi:hypothetical protein
LTRTPWLALVYTAQRLPARTAPVPVLHVVEDGVATSSANTPVSVAGHVEPAQVP